MAAIDMLRAAMEAEKDLKSLREQRRHILDLATSSSIGSEVYVQASGDSKVERAAVKMADLDQDLIASEKRYERIILEARKLIAKLPKQRHRELLTLRYLCCMPWAAVTESMGYADIKSVFRAHQAALKSADEILGRGYHTT